MPTLTVYSSTSDGELYKSHAVYATAQTSPTGTARAGLTILTLGQYYEDGLYGIHRMGLHIDASELPDDADISAGVLTLYFLNKQPGTFTNYDVTIVDGADLADPLVAADYGDLLDDTTAVASAVNTSAMSNNTAYAFTLTSAGRALISVTVPTKFAVRSSLDIAGTTPTGEERIYFSSAEEVTAQKPKLVITYTTSPTVITQTCKDVVGVTATGRGNLTATGGLSVTAHGHCWATTTNPTTALTTKIDNGAASATGTFTSAITGLTPGTGYYTRAFATNSIGTSYGANVYFIASLDRAGYIWMEGSNFRGFDENAVEGKYIRTADVDDTAVNGETEFPISSNWAYDHAASATGHPYYHVTSEQGQAFKAEYNITTDDLATYVHGVKVELTRAADIQPSNGAWFGGQFVLNAGSSGYTALDKPAYVMQAIFKGSDTSPNGTDIHVGRFETQSAGKVSDIVHVLANTGTTVTGSLEYIATHIAPSVSMVNLNAQSSVTVPTGIKIMSGTGSSYNYGIDLASATINTADIRFQGGATLVDDGTSLTLASANLVGTLGAVTLAGTVTGGNQDITQLGHIGLGNAAAYPTQGIYIGEDEQVLTAGGRDSLYTYLGGYKTASAFTGYIRGGTFYTYVNAVNTQNWTNSVGLRAVYGGIGTETGAASPSTITGAATFYAEPVDIAEGANDIVVTNYYGLYLAPNSLVGNSKLTNNYGIYIGDQAGGATLNYGIYIAGADTYAIYVAADGIYAGGGLDVVGTTTLDTALTGVLRGDSGVVSVDSDVTDLVTDATTAAKGIASFDAQHFTVTAGAVDLNIDDTPVDGETDEPITSNWAFDHADNTTTAHGAVSAATASKIVVRDAEGQAKFAAPAASGDALIKGTRITADELPAVTDEYYLVGTGANMEERAVPAAGVSDPHGAAQHTDVTRDFFAPVATYTYSGATTNWTGFPAVELATGVDRYTFIGFKVPNDFVSFTSLKIVWAGVGATAGQDWVCDPAVNYEAENETFPTHQDAPANTTIDMTAQNTLYVTDIGLTLASLAEGDYVAVQAYRRGTDDADTYAGAIRVLGMLLTYTAEQ